MSSGRQRIKWRRNIGENINRLSRVHERYRQTTDRRQTGYGWLFGDHNDGSTTTYSEHEHEFTFAKNETKFRILSQLISDTTSLQWTINTLSTTQTQFLLVRNCRIQSPDPPSRSRPRPAVIFCQIGVSHIYVTESTPKVIFIPPGASTQGGGMVRDAPWRKLGEMLWW